MEIKPIKWTFIGQGDYLYRGQCTGIFKNVIFHIGPTRINPEEFFIMSDNSSIPVVSCKGLENAKAKAQDLLNAYAISQTI